MAKKKDTKLTLRQRESQRIMREKSARKKRELWMHRLQVSALVITVMLTIGGSFWMWKTSMFSRTVQTMSDGMYALTLKAGFEVETLHLEGRNRTDMEEINKALAVRKGDPILKLSLDELRGRLEGVGSIRVAAVERELPNHLVIRIIEREPVALWQNEGKLTLVDDKGIPMPDIDIAGYRTLPLIVGKDAHSHVAEIIGLLHSNKELSQRFAAAVRISERRWNIHFKDGAQVKLPEDNPAKAWEILAKLQEKQKLLDRDVKVIDLRVAGRLFIKISPEDVPGKASDAKET